MRSSIATKAATAPRISGAFTPCSITLLRAARRAGSGIWLQARSRCSGGCPSTIGRVAMP